MTVAWLRCDAALATCATIVGATGTSYLVRSADVGSRLVARVTMTGRGGTASADSAATAAVT
jgi:hypothetical protein